MPDASDAKRGSSGAYESGAPASDKPAARSRVDLVVPVLTTLASIASAAIAVVALITANHAATEQEEANAPVLAPGTPQSDRGKIGYVNTEFARVRKRLDRLYLDRDVAPPGGYNTSRSSDRPTA